MIEWGKIITAEYKERDNKLQQAEKLKARLKKIDEETVRPLRAKVAGTDNKQDADRLDELEAQATVLRAQIAELVE